MKNERKPMGQGAKVALTVAALGALGGAGYALTRKGKKGQGKAKGQAGGKAKDKATDKPPVPDPASSLKQLTADDLAYTSSEGSGTLVFHFDEEATYELSDEFLQGFDPNAGDYVVKAFWLESITGAGAVIAEYSEAVPAKEWELELGFARLELSAETGKLRVRLKGESEGQFFGFWIEDSAGETVVDDGFAFTIPSALA